MKKLINILYVLFLSSLLLVLSWKSHVDLKDQLCEKLQITVDTSDEIYFVNREMVRLLFHEKMDTIVGKKYRDINICLLEEFVEEHPNIDKAELYLTIDGKLCANVTQRKPLARVFEQDRSYYIDVNGDEMPLSENFTARVYSVYWDQADESRKEILLKFCEFIQDDSFLSAQITAIEFSEKNELTLYPRMGSHKIILGSAQDLEKKFEKLKVFYRKGLEKVGWDRYATINLKFENQVVCTKR